jgi:ABC-type antimicrobial peptide transport system permease subunit
VKFNEIFILGWKGLKAKKVIAVLTIVSVVIGTGSIITLVSTTSGIGNSIVGILNQLGPNTILVIGNTRNGITPNMISAVTSLGRIQSVYPVVLGTTVLNLGGQQVTATIVGVDNITAVLGGFSLIAGKTYLPGKSPLAVIGYSIANPSPGVLIGVGQPIVINLRGNSYIIIVQGILNRGVVSALSNADTSIFLPLSEAMLILNQNQYSALVVKVDGIKYVDTIANEISNILGASVRVVTVSQIANTISSITAGISFLLIVVASISLFVAALGIASILMTTVYERVREIGIMMSLGMTSSNILLTFLSEAIIIGLLGGFIGVLGGIFTSIVISSFSFRFNSGNGTFSINYSPVITPDVILITIVIAVLVSVVAGIYPAWRASKLTPMEAIRSG